MQRWLQKIAASRNCRAYLADKLLLRSWRQATQEKAKETEEHRQNGHDRHQQGIGQHGRQVEHPVVIDLGPERAQSLDRRASSAKRALAPGQMLLVPEHGFS